MMALRNDDAHAMIAVAFRAGWLSMGMIADGAGSPNCLGRNVTDETLGIGETLTPRD